MSSFDYSAIGQRIKTLRKRKGLSQTELATLMGKSLRTIQKYETGEIEVSISAIVELARLLDSTPTFIIGFETQQKTPRTLADIMDFLFYLERVQDIAFDIDVRRPPHYDEWTCAIKFNGKARAEVNADICLFLEDWQQRREDNEFRGGPTRSYQEWKEATLAYYAALELHESSSDEE